MARQTNILVVSDNFLIGGREAYISTCLRELSCTNDFRGQHALLTSLFDPATPHGRCFSAVSSVTDPQNIDEWLRKAEQVIAETQVDVIWVHHYAILPALRIALKHRLPLVVTLHGAPLSQGILGEQDSLGLVLALQAGARLTVVSEEIKDQLTALGVDPLKIMLAPNTVKTGGGITSARQGELKCILLTRPQKLDHIRAAVSLCAIVNDLEPTSLTIHVGRVLNDDRAKQISRSRLLGRKWLLKNPKALGYLPKVTLYPPVTDVQRAIGQADVVLGMGRVMLEGIAENKLCVLIGYSEVKGILNERSFASYRYSNFSGRGVDSPRVLDVARQIVELTQDNAIQRSALTISDQQRREISATSIAEVYLELFSNAHPVCLSNLNDESADLTECLSDDTQKVYDDLIRISQKQC